MYVASVGIAINHPRVEHIRFSDTRTWLDFDAVIWSPTRLVDEYDQEPDRPGLFTRQASSELRADLDRRSHELRDLLAHDRVVVIFLPHPRVLAFYTGHGTNRGTRAKPRLEWHTELFDLDELLPVRLGLKEAESKRVELRGGGPLADLWREHGSRFITRSWMESWEDGDLVISGTEWAVGGVATVDEGVLVALPGLTKEAFESADPSNTLRADFGAALAALVHDLRQDDAENAPVWDKAYRLPGEAEAEHACSRSEESVRRSQRRLEKAKGALKEVRRPKTLLWGGGRALEVAVADAFRALGADADEGAPGRTDLHVRWANQHATVEVKGVTRSAAEKHAVQLEKWVISHMDTGEARPKAILVVNAYKNRAPDARPLPFPPQMLSFTTPREHALLTSQQLLGACLAVQTGEANGPEILKSIWDCVGYWDQYRDASLYLDKMGD